MQKWQPLLFIVFFVFNAVMFSQTIRDIDSNVYKTVTIGKQLWMAENLRTSKLIDGTAIPLVTDNTEWDSLKTSGYCWYNNEDSTYKITYGALYNWYAASSGKLCPVGWHVPSNAEWDTLIQFLGGNTMAGGILKEIGFDHWKTPNTGATNDVGFSALPAGIRAGDGTFNKFGNSSYWWTSTEYKAEKAFSKVLIYYSNYIYSDYSHYNNGFSVRCIKD